MALDTTEIAESIDAEHRGEPKAVSDYWGIEDATEEHLTFYTGDDPVKLEETDAGVIVCQASVAEAIDRTSIVSDSPQSDFCRIAEMFFEPSNGGTHIHTTAVIEDGAELGSECVIGPNAYVASCAELGDSCILQAGAVVGTQGYNYTSDDEGKLRHLPHRAPVILGDNVRIGANSTVDRGVFRPTKISNGTKIDSNVIIGHNVVVGENVRIAAAAELSGSVVVGDGAYIHPQVSISSHCEIGRGAEIGIGTKILKNVDEDSLVVDPTRPRRIG